MIADSLAAIRKRIDSVERRWTHDIEITAVTKTFSPLVVVDAVEAGCRAIGENYAQDLLTKREVIEAFEVDRRPRVDFIGQLQSNKVRHLAGLVNRWCTVDRPSIATEIAKRDPGGSVLIQVNSTLEQQKGGCELDDVPSLMAHCQQHGLAVLGLLTVGPTGQEPAAAAPGFRAVRALVDQLGLEVASMGMTADLEVAVECGTTNIRIGSALFGARPTPRPPRTQ
ncbi:MAG: pyridoxal phosphate enzyme (YggS family) [Candidatus Aldehydirespiratoraceae bacterium]|jgi:pyridoxal phosphate enzyme (YggS family)